MSDFSQESKYSHLTAINRQFLSFPAKYLYSQNRLKGKILDFGCGYGKDVEILQKKGLDITGYDPYYFPCYPQGKFDTICCFYVLNVVSQPEQETVIMQVSELLKPGGRAYFAVRRDIKREGFRNHYFHNKPTYQRVVKLPFQSVYLDESCEIYEYIHYNQIVREKVNENPRCIFCNPPSRLTLITESSLAYAIFDGYPLSKGHSLIIPKIHQENYFELPSSLQTHCWQMVNRVQQIIQEKYRPDGFNVGFNVHKAAGQKIPHALIHIIPRYLGDCHGKNHGIRCVIPPQK